MCFKNCKFKLMLRCVNLINLGKFVIINVLFFIWIILSCGDSVVNW